MGIELLGQLKINRIIFTKSFTFPSLFLLKDALQVAEEKRILRVGKFKKQQWQRWQLSEVRSKKMLTLFQWEWNTIHLVKPKFIPSSRRAKRAGWIYDLWSNVYLNANSAILDLPKSMAPKISATMQAVIDIPALAVYTPDIAYTCQNINFESFTRKNLHRTGKILPTW